MREVDAKFKEIMESNVENGIEAETKKEVDSMTPEEMKIEIQALRRRNLRLRNELTAWQLRAEFAEKASSAMANQLESMDADVCANQEEGISAAIQQQLNI